MCSRFITFLPNILPTSTLSLTLPRQNHQEAELTKLQVHFSALSPSSNQRSSLKDMMPRADSFFGS